MPQPERSAEGHTGGAGGNNNAQLAIADTGSRPRYKSVLCRVFVQTGTCPNGETCAEAHGDLDLADYDVETYVPGLVPLPDQRPAQMQGPTTATGRIDYPSLPYPPSVPLTREEEAELEQALLLREQLGEDSLSSHYTPVQQTEPEASQPPQAAQQSQMASSQLEEHQQQPQSPQQGECQQQQQELQAPQELPQQNEL